MKMTTKKKNNRNNKITKKEKYLSDKRDKIEEKCREVIRDNDLYREKEEPLEQMVKTMHEENTILGIIGDRGSGKTYTTELAIKTFEKLNKKTTTIKLNLWQIFKEYDVNLEFEKEKKDQHQSKNSKDINKKISPTLWRAIFYKLGYFKFLKKWFIMNAEFQSVETQLKLNAISKGVWISLAVFAVIFIAPIVIFYNFVNPIAAAISLVTETALAVVSYFSFKIRLKNNFNNMLQKGEYNILISDLLNDKVKSKYHNKWLNIHFEDLDRIKNIELKNNILQYISILYRNPKINILIELDGKTYEEFSSFIKKQNNGNEEVFKLIPKTIRIKNVTRPTLFQKYDDGSWVDDNLNIFIDELFLIVNENKMFSWRQQKSIEDKIQYDFKFLKQIDNPNLSKKLLYNLLIKKWWGITNIGKSVIEMQDGKWVVESLYSKISKIGTSYEMFLNNINEFTMPKIFPKLLTISKEYLGAIMNNKVSIEFLDEILKNAKLEGRGLAIMTKKEDGFLFNSSEYKKLFIRKFSDFFIEGGVYTNTDTEESIKVDDKFDEQYNICLWNSLVHNDLYEKIKKQKGIAKVAKQIESIPVEYSNEIPTQLFNTILADLNEPEEIKWIGMNDQNKVKLISRLLERDSTDSSIDLNLRITKINKDINKQMKQNIKIWDYLFDRFKEGVVDEDIVLSVIGFSISDYPEEDKVEFLKYLATNENGEDFEEIIVKLIDSIESEVESYEWSWFSKDVANSLINKNDYKNIINNLQKFGLLKINSISDLIIKLFNLSDRSDKELIFNETKEELQNNWITTLSELYVFGNKNNLWSMPENHNQPAINIGNYSPENLSLETLEQDLKIAQKTKSLRNTRKLNNWIHSAKEMILNNYLMESEMISMNSQEFAEKEKDFKKIKEKWEHFTKNVYAGIPQNVIRNSQNLETCKQNLEMIEDLSKGKSNYNKKIANKLANKLDINVIIEYILENNRIPSYKKNDIKMLETYIL